MATAAQSRVLDSLNHRQPDQVPIDFGSTGVTGVHVSCVAALRDHFGLEKRPVKVHEPYQMLGILDEDLKQALGIDVEGVFRRKTLFGFPNENWKPWSFNGLEVLVSEKFNTTVDANGDTLIYPEGDLSAEPSGRMPQGFHFFDSIVRQKHFDEDHLNPEDNLEEFKALTDADVATIAEDVAEAAGKGRAVIANFGGTAFGDIALVPAPFLKDPKGIRDVTEWYVSTRSRRDYIHQIFSRQCEIALENLARVYGAVGNTVDAVFLCGTDFGTQSSSFCSVPTFRELWFPYYSQVCGWIHRNTTWKCFKHSCGSVARFYPSLIEAGFDIVNPVQCSAAGMEPEGLKATFGDRLVFWGGGIDTQKVLPFGTPAEVREQVLNRCEIFAPGGGFIFNTIHNIQAGTPVENIVAMVDAVREFDKKGLIQMGELAKLHEAILNGDAKTAVAVTRQALAEGADASEMISKYMIPAMDEVGQRFECEEYFVPELLLSARAMKGALELLRPLLAATGAQPAGRVVIGTVKGDLHDIGKNLVASMLEGGGFDVVDLGADVSAERFVEAVKSSNANLVCLSALLTVTMPSMRTTIEAIKQAGLRDKVRILIGGAPVTQQFADEIGADGFGTNASVAVALARQMSVAGA